MGQQVVAVRTRFWREDQGDLWFCDAAFELASGVILRLPGAADETLISITAPDDLVVADPTRLTGVIGRRVAAILRPSEDDDFVPGSAVLVMEEGTSVYHEVCTPGGCGGGGVFVYSGSTDTMVDFWTRTPIRRQSSL